MLGINIMGFECDLAFVIRYEENCEAFEQEAKRYGIISKALDEQTQNGDTVYILEDFASSDLFNDPKRTKSMLLSEFLKHLKSTDDWILAHRNKGEGNRALIFFHKDSMSHTLSKEVANVLRS